MTLQEKDKSFVWHPFTSLQSEFEPILITKGEGVYLHTHDGRKILDGISSWWVNIHGHGHEKIAKAIADQALRLEQVIFAGFTHEPAIRLSEMILGVLPPGQKKIFFSDNGSTSVEVALKLALQFWYNQGIKNKTKVIAIEGAYHGDTFGAMSIGERGLFTSPFEKLLFDVEFIRFPDKGAEDKVLDQFKKLAEHPNAGVLIYEPLVQGASGMRIYTASFLEKLLEIAIQNNLVTIADEVFTGFGRTGKLFASDYVSHKPDILAMSKGITGGFLPLGATSCNQRIVDVFNSPEVHHTFFHGHSYTANPISCSAAVASLEILLSEECQSSIKRIGNKHHEFLNRLAGHRNLIDARSLGTILALELKTDSITSYTNSLRNKIYQHFLSRDILLRPLGNVIYVLPPYVIKDSELELIYHLIEEFLEL